MSWRTQVTMWRTCLTRISSPRQVISRGFKRKSVPGEMERVREDGGRMSYRSLIKPAQFTVAVGGCSYVGCCVLEYETKLREHKNRELGLHREIRGYKEGGWRQQFNEWWNTLSGGHRLVAGVVAVNLGVLLMWRVARPALMTTWFCASPSSRAPCWSMLLSSFSHYSPLHFALNMYVLWSFAPVVTSMLGREQSIFLYLTAGVVSSFASYAFKISRSSQIVSLGASGAIIALLGLVATRYPDARFSVALVNEIFPHSFSARSGVTALIIFDGLGALLGWRIFDHAAHLGGMLFGIWYAAYGERLLWKRRLALVTWWHRLRSGGS